MRVRVSQYGGIQPFLGVGVFYDGAGFSVEKYCMIRVAVFYVGCLYLRLWSFGNKLPVVVGIRV